MVLPRVFLFVLVGALAACSQAVGPDSGDAATNADVPIDTTSQDGFDAMPDVPAMACVSDRDCSAMHLVCGPRGICVECNAMTDCQSGEVCLGNACVHPNPCSSSRTCPGQVCSTALGYCVDCVADVDCTTDQACRNNVCIPLGAICRSSRDCSAMSQVCDPISGRCVDCIADTDCTPGEFCASNMCRPDVCMPGAARCSDAMHVETCNSNGSGWTPSACGLGAACSAGRCMMQICRPDVAVCSNATTVHTCTPDGLGYTDTTCAATETCSMGICVARICAPGAASCLNPATVQTCDPGGLSYTATMCPSSSSCRGGTCLPHICSPTIASCVNSTTVQTCSLDGIDYAITTCGPMTTCNAGWCNPWVCTPGTATCGSTTDVALCNADGLSTRPLPCPSGSSCAAGICSGWLCVPTTNSCLSSTTLGVCAADGLSYASAPCPTPANASAPHCAAAACSFTCNPGFADCDHDASNGCEVTLASDSANCGACRMACPTAPHSVPMCTAGTCGSTCAAGFADCDGNATNGCEASLSSPLSCGACGVSCPGAPGATPSCRAGVCGLACDTGTADCDGNAANGCETNTDTSVTACGACGVACPAGGTCMAGSCGRLVGGLGGPAGYGTNRLYLNDDGSTCYSGMGGPIDLNVVAAGGLSFYGMSYSQLCLNNNGNVNFTNSATGVVTYTASPFPILGSPPLLAPWWGDVDTRGGSLTDPTYDAVFWDVRPGQFVATWVAVGYFSVHDNLRNSFQIVIRSRSDVAPGDFDVEFRYARCEWVTGDASGGSGGFGGMPAQAGFDSGNGIDSFMLPGSRTADIVSLCTTSNVSQPGIWRYRVRAGRLVAP